MSEDPDDDLDITTPLGINIHWYATSISGVFVLLANCISLYSIYSHFNYPHHARTQRSLIRILIMVNIYATAAWISLCVPFLSIYLNCLRDLWEAVVIYEFFNLIIVSVGGYRVLTEDLYRTTRHFRPFNLCINEWGADEIVFWTRVGMLQYCIVQVCMAFVIFMCQKLGLYREGSFEAHAVYPYVATIISLSQSWALYVLVLFYYALAHLDPETTAGQKFKNFRPYSKFLTIKGVVFFVFWQSFFLSIALHLGILSSNYNASQIQNVFVCIEMFGFSVSHLYVFSINDFPSYAVQRKEDITPEERKKITVEAFQNTFDLRDITSDFGKYVLLKTKETGGDLVSNAEFGYHSQL